MLKAKMFSEVYLSLLKFYMLFLSFLFFRYFYFSEMLSESSILSICIYSFILNTFNPSHFSREKHYYLLLFNNTNKQKLKFLITIINNASFWCSSSGRGSRRPTRTASTGRFIVWSRSGTS